MIQENRQMLSEHQPAQNTSTNQTGYDPTTEEEKAIKLADKLFSKAKNGRKAYDEKWLDYYRMFRGKQWKDARPTYRHSEVINLIFRAIQSDVPILTDVLPKPEFIPQEPNDFALAQILNDVFTYDWIYNNWAYNFTEVLFDSHIYGTGFGSVGYDEEACGGIGAATFDSEDPFHQFPDPFARNINHRESNFYVIAKPMPVDRIKKLYPEVAQFIKPDLIDISRRDKQMSEQIKYKSPTDNRIIMEGSSVYDLEARDEALLVTVYIKDDEVIEEEEKNLDPTTGLETSLFVKRLKYPMGRKIVTCGGVLCEDSPMEEWMEKKFPYMRLTNYILPREFWGMSEIEQLESPQKIFNKMLSFSLDVLTYMGNPIWVVDHTSEVDTDNLFNRPGQIIEKAPGSEVRREPGVQLQPFVMQLIDRMKTWFDDVSGSNDVSRGVRPEGVTAAAAIEALQEAAQTRLRQKGKFVDAFMQEFGQHYLSLVFEKYTVPRVYRITNDQNVVNYFKFHVEQRMNEMGEPMTMALVRPFNQGADGSYYEGEQQEYLFNKKFDVRIATGSALPFEKSRREQQSLNLFDRQIIDAEEVLKNIRYPNYELVLKRMAEKQAAAMAEQQAAAAGMPPEAAAQAAPPMDEQAMLEEQMLAEGAPV